MEVKIGVQNAPRELVVDTTESPEEVEQRLASAVADGSPFVLSDNRGRKIMVPAGVLAYVEIGGAHVSQVGFRG